MTRAKGDCDVLVIGAGIHGAATAYHLAADHGARVVVVDSGRPMAATPRSVAVVHGFYPEADRSRLATLGLRQIGLVGSILDADIGLRRVGVVHLLDDRQLAVAADRARFEAGYQLLSRDDIDRMLGCDQTDVAGALLEPDAGYVDPVALTSAYLAAAKAAGAEQRDDDVLSLLHADGCVFGARTRTGDLHADTVVLAAGADSGPLLATAGIRLPSVVRRVQVLRLRAEYPPSKPHPVVLDTVTGGWVSPRGQSVLAGVEFAPPAKPQVGSPPDPWFVDVCRSLVRRRYPGWGRLEQVGGWTAPISSGPSARLVVDRLAPGLIAIVSESGTSFKTAPWTAVRVAQWAASGTPGGPELETFGLSRGPREDGLASARLAVTVSLARAARTAGHTTTAPDPDREVLE